MRWSKPCDSDIRVRSGFLWLPFRCRRQTRWLEFAIWREDYSVTQERWVASCWLPLSEKYRLREMEHV